MNTRNKKQQKFRFVVKAEFELHATSQEAAEQIVLRTFKDLDCHYSDFVVLPSRDWQVLKGGAKS